jgi:hypothetical protein
MSDGNLSSINPQVRIGHVHLKKVCSPKSRRRLSLSPKTNTEFRRFVKVTGYITVAERAPKPSGYPDADPALLIPGSLVLCWPPHRVGLRDYHAWWAYVPGACWKHPEGPAARWAGATATQSRMS